MFSAANPVVTVLMDYFDGMEHLACKHKTSVPRPVVAMQASNCLWLSSLSTVSCSACGTTDGDEPAGQLPRQLGLHSLYLPPGLPCSNKLK